MRKFGFIATGILSLSVCFFLSVIDSYATGFAIFAQGGSTFGQADATVAHGEDPSAIFFNPALINQFPGTQVQLGTTLIIPDREFRSALTGQKTKTESEVFFPSTFYITHAVSDKFSVGFGVFNPFGLGTTWPEDWEGRYLATKSKMTTFAFNPVASVKIAPWLTVAGGITYLTLDATFERHLNLPALGLAAADGSTKLHGTGDGFGVNAGLQADVSRDLSVGFSYRSKIHVPITGDVSFAFPAGTSPIALAIFQNTGARTSIDLPAQAYAGVYFKHFYPFTFELSTRWEGWSAFKELSVQTDNGGPDVVTPRDWHDTWAGIVSLKYQLNDKVALMGGYQYSNNPVPDRTFEPAIPDSNSHFFSVGTEVKYKALNIVLGYGYQLYEKRAKNNTITDPISNQAAFSANGDYKSRIHMVALSLAYRF